MIFFIISVPLVIIGIILFKFCDVEKIALILLIVGCVIFILPFIIFLLNAAFQVSELLDYQITKEILLNKDNTNFLSVSEYHVNNINRRILTNKTGSKNFWIGIFYNYKLGKKEFLRIEKSE
jgi:hypothetical protein